MSEGFVVLVHLEAIPTMVAAEADLAAQVGAHVSGERIATELRPGLVVWSVSPKETTSLATTRTLHGANLRGVLVVTRCASAEAPTPAPLSRAEAEAVVRLFSAHASTIDDAQVVAAFKAPASFFERLIGAFGL